VTQRLSTRVGHAEHGDNRFRGRSVHDELTGALPYWSLVALAVGHTPLSAEQCSVLDALSVASSAADPRIWPLKAVRLGSTYGSATLGLCAGLLVTDGVHGPRACVDAAELIAAVMREVGEDPTDDVLGSALGPRFAARMFPLPGFGVAARDVDERVVAFDDWCSRTGREHGRYWRLMRRIEAIAIGARRTPVNVSGAAAAVLLDLGFSAAQVHLPAVMLVLQNFVANAVEGAAQAPEVLQRLPQDSVRYVGAPPRRSPRAR
jgi:hypothetical protein